MAKPLNEFGGWLRFFQIANIIGIVIGFIMVLIFIAAFFLSLADGENFSNLDKATFIFIMIEIPVFMYFTVRILQYLKIKSPDTPGNISKMIQYILILTIITGVIEFAVYLSFHNASDQLFDTVKGTIQSLISATIWLTYFKKSVRVKQHYGRNTGELFVPSVSGNQVAERVEQEY